MSRIDELLQEHSLHSVRSDGSQMIALKTGQAQDDPAWMILFVRKDGHIEMDGTMILDTGEKAVLRKTCTNEKLQETAALQDFVEWRPGVLEEHPDEQTLMLQEQLRQKEQELDQLKTQYETAENQLQEARKRIQDLTALNTSQRRKERTTQRMDLEEMEQRLKNTA